ncbi:MAG: DUF4388 domain-containing protein [Planctomycetes bacterium]|nr:DUF4388 domain-containing protein [Planctomycetota bacterium]
MAFAGDLELMPPQELLGFLGRHSQSGRLTLDRGDGTTLSLHLEEGTVHAPLFPAVDSGRSGRIARNDHDEILARGQRLLPRLSSREAPGAEPRRRARLRGDLLVQELKRFPHQDRGARSELIHSTIQRAITWTGKFRFNPGPLPAWLLDALLNDETWSMSAAELSIEGARFRDDSTRFNREDLLLELEKDSSGQGERTLFGDLTGIGLAAVLESLQTARRSGTLEVGDEKLSVDLVFHEGRAFVMRREAGDSTASFAREFLDVDTDTARWNLSKEPSGKVHEDDLDPELRAAVRDPLFALLVHDEARFRFLADDLPDDFDEPEPGTARIELRTTRFLMEAIQRLTEWDAVRRRVGHRKVLRFTNSAVRRELIATADADTRELLTLIDGQRTFGALLAQASLGRLETGRLIQGWVEDGTLVVAAKNSPPGR